MTTEQTDQTEQPDHWTIEIDSEVCVGSGLCAGSAARAFTLDTAGRATAPASPVPADDDLLEAAENCPAAAITLRTAEEGKEIFAP
ncbi:ferredoxin [Streptomyces sp. TLI_55]|uniref:ferredoxin n=1 Tax=Streptomyces sp. TLI_55 TaxID=1938861 RepID=UPI000BCB6C87|nr:ferredoxin [Streptomyces sp. TLI_55]SNX61926.1 ferredoxin [Streptomyces sp. TLI_55]